MADSNYDDQERDFRRRWYEAHVNRYDEDLTTAELPDLYAAPVPKQGDIVSESLD